MTSVHGNASLCISATTVPMQYLFRRCLPYLLLEADSQPNVVSHLWTSLQISESMRFRTHVYWAFFLVLVGTTTPKTFDTF